jgi:cytochrome P450
MLLAGEDTTANTLAWTLWFMARHPDVLRRAAQEVRDVLGDAPVATSSQQLSQLDYLEGCANESMRLRPVAPLMVLQAASDTRVADVAVPAGTLVMCLFRPAAVDETHFANAQEFRPERWLDTSASSSKRVAMPFGAGPRMCPGRYLALAEIKMVLAMLLAGFKVEAVDTAGGEEPAERLALTMSPVGLRMRLSCGEGRPMP